MPSLRFVYGRLGDLQFTAYLYVASGKASVYFNDADNATCKSTVGLPYSVLPVAERIIFGFCCVRTRGSWTRACNTTMQYAFVLYCCDVMALCTASQISNKNIETVSCPCNTCFWYSRALAVRNTSRGAAEWRISYNQRASVSKTRIAWARDRFYFYC